MKANQATTYTKTEINNVLVPINQTQTSLNAAVTAINGILPDKADKETTYTKIQVDASLGF